MAILQVSEKIIKENFQTLEKKDNIKINHNESNLYYNNGLVYKIFRPTFRLDREKNIYLIHNTEYPHANNIIDLLYQGDKLIGVTNKYIYNFESMKTYMNKLNLQEIKDILKKLIEFYNTTINKNLIYWDNHLNNLGISNGKFYILDIDSMIKITNNNDIAYALNGVLALFYEMYYKIPIRNNYDNYKDVIFNISENDNYLKYNLSLSEINNIIDKSTENYLDSKRNILNLKKI